MAMPSEEDIERLRALAARHNDEAYHSFFDELIEAKLEELDPQWMRVMREEYEQSQMGRYCA